MNDSSNTGYFCSCMLISAMLIPTDRVITFVDEICNDGISIWNSGKWESSQGYLSWRPVSSEFSRIFPSSALQCDYNFLHGCCVGQARNPGPWSLRIQNIVSAQKHLDSLMFEDDCTVWTETTATKFTQERAICRSISNRCHTALSHPASSKQLAKIGRNEASGTMIFTKQPLRDMSGGIDAAIFNTSRIADAIVNLNGLQVRIIAIYAYHSGFDDQMAKNERLFAHAFAAASQFKIPTTVTGDFNCELSQLNCWEQATTAGFVDVGRHYAELHGSVPENTYRGESRLDYLVVNKVALQGLLSFQVDPKGFTDHAILHATFDWNAAMRPIPTWMTCYDAAQLSHLHEALRNTSPSDACMDFFNAALTSGSAQTALDAFTSCFESKLQHVHYATTGTPLPPSFLGRGRGRIHRSKPQQVMVCKTTKQASDRVCINHRLKTLDRFRELLHYTAKSSRLATRFRLWDKILKPFATWLLDEELTSYVPLSLPNTEWLETVLLGLRTAAKHWDSHQKKQKRHQLASLFNADWKAGGKVHTTLIKEPNLGTLQGLLHHQQIALDAQRNLPASNYCRVLHPDKVVRGSKWEFQGKTVSVKDVKNNLVELSQPLAGLRKSVKIKQSHWSTDTNFVASTIQTYWNTFWNSTKVPCIETMHRLADPLPQVPQFDARVSVEDLKDIIRQLPRGKARGLDNWSYAEFKLLSDNELVLLADLYNHILETSEWPEQLLHATVTLLAKKAEPLSPKDGRPITILPSLYRLWGKAMARKIFLAMCPFLPNDLYGSVPNKGTLDAAFELQSCLEEAQSNVTKAVGVSLDLSKAYNTLPRQMMELLAQKAGWPTNLIRTYRSFLDKLQRHFKLHGGLHLPTYSSIGVPEGCPIAVPVMILFTWAITHMVQNNGGRMVSFVDNWTLLAQSVPESERLLRETKLASDGLGLILNPDKTRAFAVTANDRTLLRKVSFEGHKLEVCHSTADLGVLFTTTHRPTSQSLQKRFQVNGNKFARLQALPWSATRKQEVLQRAIGPSILYGVELASTSISFISQVRAKFTTVIWGQHNHRDHYLAPLFSLRRVYEPFLDILIQRFKAVRRAAAVDLDTTIRRWNLAMSKPKSFGPFQYFFQHAAHIGWYPSADLFIQCNGKQYSVLADDIHKWYSRIAGSWLGYVSNQRSHKKEWAFLGHVDWETTMKLRQQGKDTLHILGSFSSGAAMFSDQKRHFLEEEATLCCHCKQYDTQRHRLFDCPFYEDCRRDLPVMEMRQWPDLITERGFSKKPLAVEAWDQLVGERFEPNFATFFHEPHVYYTDGSTANAASLPRSSWSVVLAEDDGEDSTVVEAGLLAGEQSNFRAELTAALVAIQHASRGKICIDNQSVVLGLNRLLHHGWQKLHWNKRRHTDLWYRVWQSLQPKLHHEWFFCHVRAHRILGEAKSKEEYREIVFNDQADRAAKSANLQWDQGTWECYTNAVREHQRQVRQAKLVFLLQERVLEKSRTVGQHQAPHQGRLRLQPYFVRTRPTPAWEAAFRVNVPQEPDLSIALMCPPFLKMLLEFVRHNMWAECASPCSIAELSLGFVAYSGWLVPINVGQWPPEKIAKEWRTTASSAWLHEVHYNDLILARQPFIKQCRIFLYTLKYIIKEFELPFTLTQSKALAHLDYFQPISCISHWPSCLRDSNPLLHAIGHSSFRDLNHSLYSPRVSPKACEVQQPHPTDLWNRYCAASRHRHR